MDLVLLTALGVGGATVIGALIGFVFKNISHRFSDIILSFAAGVMLAAAVIGLILLGVSWMISVVIETNSDNGYKKKFKKIVECRILLCCKWASGKC